MSDSSLLGARLDTQRTDEGNRRRLARLANPPDLRENEGLR